MRGSEHGTAALSANPVGIEKFYYFQGPVSLSAWLGGLFGPLVLWQRRWQQRQHLAGLDAHLLRDIGVTPREAFREAGKPFWQP